MHPKIYYAYVYIYIFPKGWEESKDKDIQIFIIRRKKTQKSRALRIGDIIRNRNNVC